MLEIKNKEQCSGCYACHNICPKQCIKLKEDENGFRYPVIDSSKCINCDMCVKVCPMLYHKVSEFKPNIYACQYMEETIRLTSSSGGLFSTISKELLRKDYKVFGATLNDDLSVSHIMVDNIDKLSLLRGSKYLQSQVNECYKEIKSLLEHNGKVLFTGTGCQIAGLKSYLDKDYNDLVTVEIVCHGVPSEKVFRKHISELEEKNNHKIVNINFRDKKDGWQNYCLTYTLDNSEKISFKSNGDAFMKGYINNLYLRPSCKSCKFKNMNSGSDILLGDFWGVNELGAPWNDNKGTSVMFINTDKGLSVFESIKEHIKYQKVDMEFATRFNPCIISPVSHSFDIYDHLDDNDLSSLVELYSPKKQEYKPTIKDKIKNKIKVILRR